MGQELIYLGNSWLSNSLLSIWMAPFCCPITPFHPPLKMRLPQLAPVAPRPIGQMMEDLLRVDEDAGVHNYLKELHMEQPGDYCITYNGALVQKAADGSTVAQTALSYDDYRFLEKLSREVGSHFHALDRTTLYTANRDISYYTVHESFVATIPLVFCEAEKMDPNTQFLKVMMIDEPAILDQAIARIPQEVKEKYTVLKSAPYFLEILDKRVNKGTGVKSLADVLGIKPEEIMAIGDQENDIAMIEYAGVGVAMDNAIPSVKEVANFVTKSNLEDGVAFAIEKYVLN